MGGSALLRALRHRGLLYNGQRWMSGLGRDGEEIQTMLEEAYTDRGEEEKERPRLDRRSLTESTVLLFPGQGSQELGMAGGLLKYPNVREMFLTANKVLGYDLLDLCLRGPIDMLNKTVYCQPAIFVTCVAATEKLTQENPTLKYLCIVALYAVKVRAEAMQKASDAVPSGMLSVVGKWQTKYSTACAEAQDHCLNLGIKDPVCEVANYLFPNCRVIAGHMEAIQFLQDNSRKYNFSRTKLLPVSGAFHTRLMEPAVEPLAEALKGLTFMKPLVNVYCNVDGRRYKQGPAIAPLLTKQLVSPVRWEQIMHAIYERRRGKDVPRTYELGPGQQMGAILKACNLKAWRSYRQVDVFKEEDTEVA
ncbi:PREDICTED: malonyl-CoA-acyl carrier protein transacylase, mitochondrial [Nanorana parkeri]|uniref:malonyl-CoA-acyl carrier protein transacylase, mitochondrial n=1 Tax=Nanorana parkeri TaxID=125878 RepID=UPI000854CB56|nr:PREDICTED: malonyl-CoA-acyl carrier protein transacylase, mitochondrial [Nanorana parkeri]